MRLPIFLFSVFSIACFSQVGAPVIIDGTTGSTGITKIIATDINNDGRRDIVVSQGYNVGSISYYTNNPGMLFSSKNTIDTDVPFAEAIVSGDFNNDGWQDIATIGRQDGTVGWYANNNGNFSSANTIDSGLFMVNAIVAADFDGNGSDDIVVIGQHSIDLYRNNGSGNFTKEHILTTETSPNILECLSLKVADMNGDTFPDLVTGETLGPVVYFNSGLGIFTPQLLSPTPLITTLVQPSDMDNDGDTDILAQDATGQISWYSNNGNGVMTFVANLFTVPLPTLRSLEFVDYNNDGFRDIFFARANKIVVYTNNGNATYGNEIIIHQDNNLSMREVALADLDNSGTADYIWAAVNYTLAWQSNTSILGNTTFPEQSIVVFPNPSGDFIRISSNPDAIYSLTIRNEIGQEIRCLKNISSISSIDISGLANGVYFLELVSGSEKTITKFLKK